MSQSRRRTQPSGYLLPESAHARLCRLYEHLSLLALLSEACTASESGIPMTHWAACLHTLADELDHALAAAHWQS